MKFLIKCFWYIEATAAIVALSCALIAIASDNWISRMSAVLVGFIAMYLFALGIPLIRK